MRKPHRPKGRRRDPEYDAYCARTPRPRLSREVWYRIVHREEYLNKKLRERIRSQVATPLSGNRKSRLAQELLGCTIDEARRHLERQFKPGMYWSNYGAWHIDHVKPCCSFDMTDPEQQRACFHYTNLQPLWAIDNMRKGRKLDWKPGEATA